MTYTIWSGDTLIGSTTLELPSVKPGERMGKFEPAPGGEGALAVLLEASAAMTAMLLAMHARFEGADAADPSSGQDVHEWVRGAPTFERATAAARAVSALALELRDASGERIPATRIGVSDGLAFWRADEDPPTEERRAALEAEGVPRYLITATMPETLIPTDETS